MSTLFLVRLVYAVPVATLGHQSGSFLLNILFLQYSGNHVFLKSSELCCDIHLLLYANISYFVINFNKGLILK